MSVYPAVKGRCCGDCQNYITHTGNDAHGNCKDTGAALPWYNTVCVKFRQRKEDHRCESSRTGLRL